MKQLRELLTIIGVLSLVAIVSAALPNQSMTSLSHMNSTSTKFIDESEAQWSTIGSAPIPNINTSLPKFGTGAGEFYGTASTASALNSSAWVWGNNHTFEMWIFPNNTASSQDIYYKAAGSYAMLHLLYDGVNKKLHTYASSTGGSWDLANDAQTVTNGIPLNQWSHIELDYAKPSLKIYVNGILNSTQTWASNPVIAASNITISDNSNKYGGLVDERAEWNITLHLDNFTPPANEYNWSAGLRAPVASFINLPNPALKNIDTQFTDTSYWGVTEWTWDFGDGNYTDFKVANPKHLYTSTGTYNVKFNATNWYGSNNYSADVTVVNASGFNTQNIFMAGQFVSTVHVTADGIALPDVAVTTSDTQSANTSVIGYANFTHPMGTYLYYFVKSGYDSKTVSIIIDSDTVTEVQMAKSVTTVSQKQNTLYPHETRFICIDRFGNRLAGLEVTARMDNTTLLGNWLQALYGVDAQTSPALNATMSGSTDSFGSIVFPVIASGKYTMTFTGPTIVGGTSTKTIYPDEGTTVIILATTNSEMVINKWGFLNGTLLTGEPNSSWIFLNFSYTDLSLTTTQVTYYVAFPNQSLKYIAVSPATPTTNQSLNKSYAVPNIKGNAYVWGWFSNSTLFGNSSGSQGITLKGPSGMLIDIFSPRTGWD